MSRLALALVAGLAGCATGPRAWVVSGDVSATWASRAVVLAEEVRRVVRPAEPWGGVIVVHPDRFPCCPWDGTPCGTCAGWNPSATRVEVAATPDPLSGDLAHELAHAALCRPGGDCREETASAAARLAVGLAQERLQE